MRQFFDIKNKMSMFFLKKWEKVTLSHLYFMHNYWQLAIKKDLRKQQISTIDFFNG